MSLTTLFLNLSHFLGSHLLLFFLMCLDILRGDVVDVRSDAVVRPIHAYDSAFVNRSLNDTKVAPYL